jgi:endonuclease YncB( thermonuclease family)
MAFQLVVVFWAALLALPARTDDADSAGAAVTDEEPDETKALLKQLTIGMVGEIIDERTFVLRDTTSKSRKMPVHMRLGNVGVAPRSSLSDGEYEEKVQVAKEALRKALEKNTIWYKAAPSDVQPANQTDASSIVVADVWSMGGRHVSSVLLKDGHLTESRDYDSGEFGKDILSAASEKGKEDSYKKLEEALKENEEAKKAAAKAARAKELEEEKQNVEPLGIAGWIGISLLLILVVGAATNFGKASTKKSSLNRKKGFLERFWIKLKGA